MLTFAASAVPCSLFAQSSPVITGQAAFTDYTMRADRDAKTLSQLEKARRELEQERAADAFAIDVMHKLGRSPKPLGELLVRVTGTEATSSMTLLSSHPLSEDRLALMSKDTGSRVGPELLSAAEWKALKNICAAPPRSGGA